MEGGHDLVLRQFRVYRICCKNQVKQLDAVSCKINADQWHSGDCGGTPLIQLFHFDNVICIIGSLDQP